MAEASQHESEPQEAQPHLEKPFSLAPSIFTPFSAFSKDPQPTTPEEKITRILQNVNTQHEAVRRNMIGLLQERGKALARRAEEELASIERDHGDDNGENESGEEKKRQDEVRRSREEMLRRMRVKARAGARPEDYQIKPGSLEFTAAPTGTTDDGDHEMSGMGSSRSAAAIRQELSSQMRDLVDRGVAELEAYDKHAAETADMYKRALKRREERRGSTSTSAGQSPVAPSTGGLGGGRLGGGILKNGHEQNLLDGTPTRRISTGTLTGVTTAVNSARTLESMDEVARRGSASK